MDDEDFNGHLWLVSLHHPATPNPNVCNSRSSNSRVEGGDNDNGGGSGDGDCGDDGDGGVCGGGGGGGGGGDDDDDEDTDKGDDDDDDDAIARKRNLLTSHFGFLPSLAVRVISFHGQTGRMLGSRIREHKLAVRRGDTLSQVAAHTYEMGHEFNFAATKIVAQARNKTGRELIEAWASDENSVNRFIDLAPVYRALRSHLQSCAVGRRLA
nr:unnamed protein product [Spirometra erinaceieuropaei]